MPASEVINGVRPVAAENEWRRGWRVVASAFVGNGIGFNLFMMASGLFVIPMQQELGLSRTAVMVSPVAFLLVSLLGPIVALHLDRHGPRMAVIGGMAIIALSYTLLAMLPATPAIYYALTLLFVLGGTVTGTMAFSKGVSLLFKRQAGIAFGVTQSGVSLVSALVVPLLSLVIVEHGWRAGYLFCAALAGGLGIPVLLAGFKPPLRPHAEEAATTAGAAPSIGARQHLRSRHFWILAFSISCGTFCIGGFMSHFYPMLIAGDIAAATAAGVLSTYAVSIGGGRILVGFLLDRLPPTVVASTCMLLTSAGAVLLYFVVVGPLPHSFAFLAAFLLGWGQGAEADFTAFFTHRRFGHQAFATMFAWMAMFAGASLALGGLLFAYSYDVLQSYEPAIVATAILWLIAAVAMMFIRLPPIGEEAAVATEGNPR